MASRKDVQRMILAVGAPDVLTMCDRALARQEQRLKAVSPEASGQEGIQSLVPDVWLTLVALRGAERALSLASKVDSPHRGEIRALKRGLLDSSAVQRARNVYEHLDEYFLGRGNLQEKEGWRRDQHLPQIMTLRDGAGSLQRVEVRIGGAPTVDILTAVAPARAALKRALELLDSVEDPGS